MSDWSDTNSSPHLVPAAAKGQRLDTYLAARHPEHSRARLQALIKSGEVTVNGAVVKASAHVTVGDVISLTVPPPEPPPHLAPEDIPLEILYQDHDLLVIVKPAGLVVHPGAGVKAGTLVNALLHHVTDLSGIGGEQRPGIVHRLDKNTSGLLLVAKHDSAHRALATAIQRRAVKREYLLLAWGSPREDVFTVDAAIGRHPTQRTRMAVAPGGRHSVEPLGGRHSVEPPKGYHPAVTHITVRERLSLAFAAEARLETGRTHQIRVHLHSLGFPLVGDAEYTTRTGALALARLSPGARAVLAALPGQALHATRLTFAHPLTGEPLSFEAPPPPAFMAAWEALRVETLIHS